MPCPLLASNLAFITLRRNSSPRLFLRVVYYYVNPWTLTTDILKLFVNLLQAYIKEAPKQTGSGERQPQLPPRRLP